MKKRFFFRLIMGVVIALPLFSSCNATQKKSVGLQLYSIRNEISHDLEGSLDSVSQCGYSFVEAANYNNGKFYKMEPLKFVELLNEYNLDFISSHCGHACPKDLNDAKTIAWWKECIAAHKVAGVKYIVQPWMGGDAYRSIDGLKKYCDYFNKVGEMCNEAGIRFGYHNHAGEFRKIGDQVIYDYMLKNTDPSKVFFQMDVYWVVKGAANPVDYFKKYPGRFLLWHIKDVKEIGDSGLIDFKSIYENYKKSGVEYTIVEHEGYSGETFTCLRKSFNFLQNSEFVKKDYSH